ncbi:MAG: restriction endonuclease [Bacilli bacterium]|nr:restriction endonuclease [Bacilli bacterium]
MAADYNYLNLDSYEFELLCSDVLSIYLNKEFRVFAPGPDGGVDIKQENGSNEIIGQAKRYKDASIPLAEELAKIKKKKECKKYYFFISCKLSDKKKTEIFNTFAGYMDDQTFIFDSIRLNELLEDDKYENILKKHFRLWATSLKVLKLLESNNVLIDSKLFLDGVKNHQRYYVDTSEYYTALKIFEEQRIVLIKGNAGVGKTTTSEMIVLSFLNKYPKARFIYSSSGNIDLLRNSLSNNPSVTELVFIDDFLGDIYLDLKGDKIKNISSFVNYFKHTPNKFLIINTRVVILKDALNKFIDFSNSLSSIGVKEIELSNLTKKDKALILYNHIYFSDISEECKKTFLEKKLYIKIVEHSHYNPRLIETICNNKQFQLSGLDFEHYVTLILNEQSGTWKHAFDNNLGESDRILLLVLYSFGQTYVKYDSLEKAFMYEIKKNTHIDKTMDLFEQSMSRLSGAFINVAMLGDIRVVNFINPSIKDCIKDISFFDDKSDFIFIDQYLFSYGYEKFLKSNKLKDIIMNNELSGYNFENYTKSKILSLFFSNNVVLDKQLEDSYLSCLTLDYSSGFSKIGNSYNRDVFAKLIDESYLSFYDLKKLTGENLYRFIINCFVLLKVPQIEFILELLNQEELDTVFDDNFKATIIEYYYSNYDKKDAIDHGINYVDSEDGPIETFDEESAKEFAVYQICEEINDDFGAIFEKYWIDIDEDDVNECIESSDFEEEYSDSYKDYEHDSDYYGGEDGNCYEIFQNLLRK